MVARQSEEGTKAEPARVGDTVVLKPTARQRIGSALLKALCAAPLLLALPVMSGNQRRILIWVAAIAAVVSVVIVLLAERDLWVKVSPTGLTTRSGSIPWWAIDEIRVHDESKAAKIVIRSWRTAEMTLPAPRNGLTGANPNFEAEARLIIANWKRYSQVVPTDPPGMEAVLKRAEAAARNADVDDQLIDLRDSAPEPAERPPVLERPLAVEQPEAVAPERPA